jgi:hypothetical protein
MVEQNVVWTASDGQRLPVYRIESRARAAQARYPRIVSTVRKDNFVVVHATIHNRRNELHKRYEVRRLEKVQGIWTVFDAAMTNTVDRTRTELASTSVQYNVGLKESDFSRRELERK